ncbi:MAG: hypothetical protein R8G60_10940 [Roseovarius pacificus]|nr:hypothetical protein [Roseovarius pacificus]
MELLISLIAGALGGNIAGGLLKNVNLGVLGNSIAGIVGGGLGGQLLSMVGAGGIAEAAGRYGCRCSDRAGGFGRGRRRRGAGDCRPDQEHACEIARCGVWALALHGPAR